MGSIMVRMEPIMDSTTICPLPGTSFGFPTVRRMKRIRMRETTELVTIELVMGKP